MTRLEAVRQRIRELRGFRSQREIARLSGLDVSTISRLERGKFDPSITTLEALAPVLGVSFDDLVAYEDGKATPDNATTLVRPQSTEESVRQLFGMVADVRSQLDTFREELAGTNDRLAALAALPEPVTVKQRQGRTQ